MIIPTILQLLCGILSVSSILYQKRYNRIHRSIYGLSYDLYLYDILGHLISLYCSINYKYSPLVRRQLANRYPLFYSNPHDIPISILLLLKDILMVYCDLLIFRQLYHYRTTKHIHQGISSTSTVLIIIFPVFTVFTFACSCLNLPIEDSGKFGIFYLDHINYLWIIGNFFLTFKFIPQISLNWMGLSTTGLSSKFVILNTLSNVTYLLIYYILSTTNLFSEQDLPFWKWPFNFKPIFVICFQLLSLLFILYQAQFLYIHSKNYLPKGKGSSSLF
ncbi:uncharacterized protein NDAI_0G04360 [Naumovozyma dairenensis CBS 421]|uniref:Uncharacterized protein n=1 Tax=Naumovozyma dairenensis (strain ATCC 10597 / BCRC 20456 / CBS 421 / NBRC 0211 / NRRL Y-12639) TaxID=1071378 RepID=J7S4F3_NAUDC|nr:hypothetical protein NDAI_0G04360 [Naumovozyma dairenensis CBS 421]CCK73421.1 hypothetical protein NDAI_0G04360 [Naumovozyma dairenensis CBS 421]